MLGQALQPAVGAREGEDGGGAVEGIHSSSATLFAYFSASRRSASATTCQRSSAVAPTSAAAVFTATKIGTYCSPSKRGASVAVDQFLRCQKSQSRPSITSRYALS